MKIQRFGFQNTVPQLVLDINWKPELRKSKPKSPFEKALDKYSTFIATAPLEIILDESLKKEPEPNYQVKELRQYCLALGTT